MNSLRHSNQLFAVAAALGIITVVLAFLVRLYIRYLPREGGHLRPGDLVLDWSIPGILLTATLTAAFSAIYFRSTMPPNPKLRFAWLWVLGLGSLGLLILRWVILSARS